LLPQTLLTNLAYIETLSQKALSSVLKQNPISSFKKWGLEGLLHGPAFQSGVAGFKKPRKGSNNIKHNKQLKSI
jgi:hypothetical protein